ncbi:hypothetical protein V1279_007585 [Bradyrhizobium sp. AZCC 1610]|uniref:hypothetical protein n=1 Tax=Bradyrhizobium sp. AZCC 1610 TaxID=3117020 RepID=UPI002FF31CCA
MAAEVSGDISNLHARFGNGVMAFAAAAQTTGYVDARTAVPSQAGAAQAVPAEMLVRGEHEEEAAGEPPDLGFYEAPQPGPIEEPSAEAVAPQPVELKEEAPGAEAPAAEPPSEVAGKLMEAAANKEEAMRPATASAEDVKQSAKAEVEGGKADATAKSPASAASGAAVTEPLVEGPAAAEGGAPAGAEAAPELAEWEEKATSATHAISAPRTQPVAVEGSRVVRAAGTSARRRATGSRSKADKEAMTIVPPPPQAPDPLLPPEQDPVPAASNLVRATAGRKLPDQVLPALVMTPGKIMPEPVKPVSAEYGTKVETAAEMELQAQEAAATAAGNQKELRRIRKSREARQKKFKAQWREGLAEPLVVRGETAEPPPPAPVTKQTQTEVGHVLAALSLMVEPGAQEIVDAARRDAYPQKVLTNSQYDDFGTGVRPEVEKFLYGKINAIGKAVGFEQKDLDRFVAERRAQLADDFLKSTGSLIGITEEEKAKLKAEWQKNADQAAGQRRSADQYAKEQAAAMHIYGDPAPIFQLREKLVRAVARKTAQLSIGYIQAGDRRGKVLTDAGAAMREAYMKAARQEEANYLREARKTHKPEAKAGADAKARTEAKAKAEADAKAEAELLSTPTFDWLKVKLDELARIVEQMKSDAKTIASSYDAGVKGARGRAIDMIGTWAEAMGAVRERGWFEQGERDIDWEIEAQESAAAWEAARTSEARDAVVRDLDTLRDLKDLQAGKIDQRHAFGGTALTEQQNSVIGAYYAGEAKGDSILTVANRLRERLSVERRPELIQQFDYKLNHLDDDARWHDVEGVALAQRPGLPRADWIASEVYKAAKGAGTDEDRIYRALAVLTPLLTLAARMCYRHKGYGDLDARLDDELSGAEYKRAKGLIEGNQGLAGASAIRLAVFPGAYGGDVDTVMQVLSTTPAKDLREGFKSAGYGDLDKYLELTLKGKDLERAKAFVAGQTTTAYAITLEKSVAGEDRKGVEAVYAQIRADVERDAKADWKTEQVEAEVKKRGDEVERIYNERRVKEGKAERTYQDDLKESFSGASLDLALALHDNKQEAADVARLKLQDKAVLMYDPITGAPRYVGGDRKAIEGILKSQAERARRETERDLSVELTDRYKAFALRQEMAMLRGRSREEIEAFGTWDWKAERDKVKEQIEIKTKERAQTYTSALKAGYEEKNGIGSLDAMLDRNLTGTHREKARDMIAHGGILEPEQAMHYAVEDEDADAVKSVLAGKKKADIDKMAAAWAKTKDGQAWLAAHKGKTFNDYVVSEFGGREKNDIAIALEGEPQTPQEMLAQKRKKLEYEKRAYGWAAGRSPEQLKRMKEQFPDFEESDTDIELRNMEEEVALLEKQVAHMETLTPGTEAYEVAHTRYQLHAGSVDQAATNYRDAIDFETDRAAMIVGIIVTGIVIVATLGAAAPVVAAAAALAGAAASIATKIALKGSAYYETDELMTDIVVGVVDAAVSAATAGLGGKLLKLRPLAKLAQSAKLAPRLLAHGLAEGAENFISAVPSAIAAQMMDKKRDGLNFSEIFTAGAMGAALGGGLGMVGGLKKPAAKAAGQIAETADILARRGTPTERLAGWRLFQEANPGKSYKEFLADLDAGILARQADEEAVRQAQKKMREELFTDIPHAQRGQFKDVPIHVVSDAEFEGFTRSAKGQAVVVIEDGKPRVLLRESADPRVLREEGIHLLQSADPEKAHLFRQLDESVLSKWDDLPLDEQLSLYGKKLDLEIDGQQRLLKNLNEALAAAGDDAAARKQILGQIENAERTLDNLSRRLDDVADITPQRRLDIARGRVPKPDYLQQPARLFSKAPEMPRLEVKQKLVAALKAAELDAEEAKRVLEKLRKEADIKGLPAAFDAVADHAGKLPPTEAKAFLDTVGKAMDACEHAPKAALDLVTASTKMRDPGAFLSAAAKLAGEGKAAERISAEALETVVEKVSSLHPEAGHRFVASLAKVAETYPKKAADLSGFMIAAARLEEPGPFVAKLKDFSETLKKIEFEAGTLREIGETVGKLDPDKAGTYFDSIHDLFKSAPADLKQLDGFLAASTKAADPGRYVSFVKDLNARRFAGALDDEAVEILAKKAGAGTLDLDWLAQTRLFTDNSARSNKILNFLALDDSTKWATFKDASAIKGKTIKEIFRDGKLRNKLMEAWRSLKGAAGEMIVEARIIQADAMDELVMLGVRSFKRQRWVTGTISDFLVEMGDKAIRGLEVKSFSETFWRNMLKGLDELENLTQIQGLTRKEAELLLKKEQKQAVAALEHLMEQLEKAAASGHAPILVVGDTLKKLRRGNAIEQLIKSRTGLERIIFMSDDAVTKLTKEMKILLDLPF